MSLEGNGKRGPEKDRNDFLDKKAQEEIEKVVQQMKAGEISEISRDRIDFAADATERATEGFLEVIPHLISELNTNQELSREEIEKRIEYVEAQRDIIVKLLGELQLERRLSEMSPQNTENFNKYVNAFQDLWEKVEEIFEAFGLRDTSSGT